MTTLVFDGTILASDGLRTQDGMRILSDTTPKFRIVKGHVVGLCGEVIWCERFLKWYGAKRRTLRSYPKATIGDDTDACAAVYDGKRWWQYLPDYEHKEPLDDRWALGSGKPYAMTALELGHGAVDAVRVACKLDIYSGGPMYAAHLGHYIESKGTSIDAVK